MWRDRLILLVLTLAMAACNLSNEPPTATAAEISIGTETPFPTPALTSLAPAPTAMPSPAAAGTSLGVLCQVYTTFSGSDPANVLSMRALPSADSDQVIRVPNNTNVFAVPNSQEVEAEGYHWLNVIYVDAAQNRYQGWIARDSFMSGGVRDPSIATLRSTGQQASC